MMLKIILYAYTKRGFSGRKIEFILDNSYRMRWLDNHEQVSYRTINRFRNQETTAHILAEAFVLFRRQLITNQVIDNEAIFIDGTKIEADVNKFSFVWRKATNRYEAALDKQSNEFYQTLYKEEQSDYLPRKQKYETYNRLFQERNNFSKTDTDSTFMRMKDDYMLDGQLNPDYNLQIATENQYVLAYDLLPNPTDTKTLNMFLYRFLEQYNELSEYRVYFIGVRLWK